MKKTSGFTLVEVLAAVTVVTIGIVAMNQALMRCIQASRVSEDRIFVSGLLELKMTEVVMDAETSGKNPADPAPVPAAYKIKVEKEIVIKNEDEELFLHSIRAEGPLHASLSASLLTAVPKKDSKA